MLDLIAPTGAGFMRDAMEREMEEELRDHLEREAAIRFRRCRFYSAMS